MKYQEPLKLFISYSREDEQHIKEFKKHTAPLKDEKIIDDWYDREIVAGKNWKKEINNNLDNADIICLFVSANFLSSEACKREIEKAFELQKKKGIQVIPIILSDCAWKDNKNISELLALPNNGKSIDTWDNKDTAWNNVYEGLKKVIEEIKQLKTPDEFEKFPNDAEKLTHAHNEKATVQLDNMNNFYNNSNDSPTDRVDFQYENNNGLYVIGSGDYTFGIKFSGAGSDSLYVYNDHVSVDCLAIAEGITSIDELNQDIVYNGTSRVRNPHVDEIFLLKNTHGRFSAIKIIGIKLIEHGNINNSVAFEYVIFPKDQKFKIAGEKNDTI